MCRMKVEAVKFEEQAEFLPTVFENRRERKTVVLEFSYLSDSLEQAARENRYNTMAEKLRNTSDIAVTKEFDYWEANWPIIFENYQKCQTILLKFPISMSENPEQLQIH
ncbi:uncharacterized protein LOC116851042 isoform X1 [Odontomachus brunneus]|uniref:uncharacterized protein LOC116851042 isoform X1 n=1 Tax=Odontomachus brunneus TaxID=486640 RepID=UPI0013F1E73A|nr:uncharacterized protein LOC116851042 isoform X1 [Odontomachus brunneus]